MPGQSPNFGIRSQRSPATRRPRRHLPSATSGPHVFIPQGHEPGYRYPLLVWLPDRLETAATFDLGRVMARVSLRNFVAVEAAAGIDREAAVWRAVDAVRRQLAIHPRRTYLVGVGAGGTEAFRIACRHPNAFAGAASLDGSFPLDEGSFGRLHEVRRLPMLLCSHRDADPATARALDRTLRLFHAAGSLLAVRIYPERDPLSPAVLADVNRWVMEDVCGAVEPIASACGR
jgi:pimeloyl-ACP methyl ester carboxylesterase